MSKALVGSDGVTVTGVNPHDHAAVLDAANIHDPQLRYDYTYSRALLDHHGKSYAQATLALPAAKRPYVWALYGFARHADEYVDSFSNPDPQELISWGSRFQNHAAPFLGVDAQPATGAALAATDLDGIGRAMVHTMATWNMSYDLVDAFLASMRMDITITEYPLYSDLEEYMYGSAAVIGLQMAHLLEPSTPDALPRARALGEAFQLTNFLRDIGEDLERGRCYMPLEDLHKFDVTVADLRKAREVGQITTPIREALQTVANRAHDLYAFADPGIGMLRRDCQPGIRCAFNLYREILLEVERRNFDVLNTRVVVPKWRRLMFAAPAIISCWFSQFGGSSNPQPHQVMTHR